MEISCFILFTAGEYEYPLRPLTGAFTSGKWLAGGPCSQPCVERGSADWLLHHQFSRFDDPV